VPDRATRFKGLLRALQCVLAVSFCRVSYLPVTSEHTKERDKAILEVAEHGWYVARETGNNYLIMHCSCGKHRETLKKTPSNPQAFREKTRKMIRDCSTQRGVR
jgi:hypothetical protein